MKAWRSLQRTNCWTRSPHRSVSACARTSNRSTCLCVTGCPSPAGRFHLLSIDRLAAPEIKMTQELIANMLGVRREGVTEAAGKLQKAGVISYRRGHIKVLDRPNLEKMSCECYEVVRRETDRLLPL